VSAPLTFTGRERLPLDGLGAALGAPDRADDATWHARLVTLDWPAGLCDLRATCLEHHVRVVDTIESQLADLAMARFPSPDAAGDRRAFVEDRVRDTGDAARYGCWAWFPWLQCIVHVLPPDEFFEVITNRNQDKLTREEQHRLRTKRIGIVGLSVGGEAAVTMAQEHLAGAIVLADFDTLDLSNLNRLGAGVDELSVNKAVIVARRIARINPYLAVTLYRGGVTESNAHEFLRGLDLLVEECDSLPLKLSLRQLARDQRLDVIFAGDERGFLSVEPYRTHPGLQPFHGLVTHAPRPRASYPTPLAFMRDLTVWLGGWDRISERSRESLVRVGSDLAGYPQLASEARFAAGQLGHVARRLLLDDPLPPSWQHLDLDELLHA
jgi:tRNA threonylcarbamoyladenosine dehydratase